MKVVIFSMGSDYTRRAYSDALLDEDVRFYDYNIVGLYTRFCNLLHIKPIKMIYKLLFFYIVFCNGYNEDKLFIYHGMANRYMIKNGFLDYTKQLKSKSYHVFVMWDVFDFEKLEDLEELKRKVDEIVIPDSIIAKKYMVTFYPLFYSKKNTVTLGDKSNQVVFFCGEDGGRLELLKSIAAFFSNNNIKYSFYCSNSKKVYTDELGIHYIKKMNHDEYVERVSNCSVLLDLVKPGSTCCTLRFCEAVLYKTKLLSNNQTIMDMECFDNVNMKVFDKIEDIDLCFVKAKGQVDYEHSDSISPVAFINTLREKMSKVL